MQIKRFSDAKPYEAPNHFDCRSLRLAGFEDGGPENFWVGCSHFLPGGGAGPDSSPMEKVYVILSGELTIRVGGVEQKAGPMDSVTIPGGEVREIVNQGNDIVTMIVAMPYPAKP
ncbi:MAG: cupin domain-containing protein [Rhodobacteraceae bacterium]|nr:cupin domain-containing protein [Paracoccaceae bacterium]